MRTQKFVEIGTKIKEWIVDTSVKVKDGVVDAHGKLKRWGVKSKEKLKNKISSIGVGKLFSWLTTLSCLILSVVAIIIHFIPNEQGLSATEIYYRCLYNVVEVKSTEGETESFGTGELISSEGEFITNSHVVTYTKRGEVNTFSNYYIRFSFEEEYHECVLIRYDDEIDLAILKLINTQGMKIRPITLGDSSKLKAGEKVYALGNASNCGIGIFEGTISIPLVNIEYDDLSRVVIQCDLTIVAGNSGGALINEKGELIGITTFRIRDNANNVIYGIAYCIPVNTVTEFVKN